jgi:geranylgeranyl pyrophosphate synthase
LLSLVRAHVADAVLAHAAPALHADLVRLLARPGYALHPQGPCRAGLFALEVYAALRGRHDRTALVAAAAVELQMQSAYVFDDVADGRPGGTRAEDLALAIALLTAATSAAAEAVSDSPDPSGTMRHFCETTSGACAGQFLDARLERRGGATLEESLEMTRLKSGSLGAFAAGFAARVAGADPADLEVFERLGFNTFTFAQLVDDQRDACGPGPGSDLAQAKATLPVVFYRQRNPLDISNRVDGRISGRTCETYATSGAPVYAAIVALAYLGRARADLNLLADRGYVVAGLGRFLDSVESDATATLGTGGCGVDA